MGMDIDLKVKMSFEHTPSKNQFLQWFQKSFPKYDPESTFIIIEVAHWRNCLSIDDFFQIFINPEPQKCIDGKQIEISRSLLETILKECIARSKRGEKELEKLALQGSMGDIMVEMEKLIQTLQTILNDPDLKECDEFYYTVSY